MVNKGVSEAELEGVEAAISSSEGTFKSTLRPATQIYHFHKLKSTENCHKTVKTPGKTPSKQG